MCLPSTHIQSIIGWNSAVYSSTLCSKWKTVVDRMQKKWKIGLVYSFAPPKGNECCVRLNTSRSLSLFFIWNNSRVWNTSRIFFQRKQKGLSNWIHSIFGNTEIYLNRSYKIWLTNFSCKSANWHVCLDCCFSISAIHKSVFIDHKQVLSHCYFTRLKLKKMAPLEFCHSIFLGI